MGEKQSVGKSKKKQTGLTVFLIVLVVFTITILTAKIAGVRLYAVTSGSMEPALTVGEAVLVVPSEFSDLKQGDIITFYINEDLQTATHRIVAVNKENESLLTKGDHNDSADGSPVLYGNVVGKVAVSVPFLGYLLIYLSSVRGKITVGVLLLILVILLFFWDDKATGKTAPDQLRPVSEKD